MQKYLKEFICIEIGLAVGASAVYLANMKKIELADEVSVIFECEAILSEFEVPTSGELDKKEVLNGWLSAYDKYTYCYEYDTDSKEAAEEYVNGAPTAVGCGFQIEFSDNDDLILAIVQNGSKAEEQGLSEGDKIISIDGVLINENGYESAKKLLGKDGTKCTLVIEHDGEQKEIEFTRHSGDNSENVGVVVENYGTTLYMSVARFPIDLNTYIYKNLNEHEFDSFILDLRNNPGGSTSAAMNVAENFISEGVFQEKYYNGEVNNWHIKSDGGDVDVPIVVLINEKTASAAEILTALLKQYGDATLVGANTFGKGIFQNNVGLGDGIMFKFTAGEFVVGDWECWQGVGIAPDIEIEMDRSLIGTDDDVQLAAAIALLKHID